MARGDARAAIFPDGVDRVDPGSGSLIGRFCGFCVDGTGPSEAVSPGLDHGAEVIAAEGALPLQLDPIVVQVVQ